MAKRSQIDKLAKYLQEYFAGDITEGGAVDNAIKLLDRLKPRGNVTWKESQIQNILNKLSSYQKAHWEIYGSGVSKFLVIYNEWDRYQVPSHNMTFDNGKELLEFLAKDQRIRSMLANPNI